MVFCGASATITFQVICVIPTSFKLVSGYSPRSSLGKQRFDTLKRANLTREILQLFTFCPLEKVMECDGGAIAMQPSNTA